MALAALCNEYYALETGEADPARQGEWAAGASGRTLAHGVWALERCLLLQVDRAWEAGARDGRRAEGGWGTRACGSRMPGLCSCWRRPSLFHSRPVLIAPHGREQARCPPRRACASVSGACLSDVSSSLSPLAALGVPAVHGRSACLIWPPRELLVPVCLSRVSLGVCSLAPSSSFRSSLPRSHRLRGSASVSGHVLLPCLRWHR